MAICRYVRRLFLATLIVMLRSETLVDSVWLLIVLFVLLNGFFSSLTSTRATVMKISMCSIFRVCYNGEWYNTRFVPEQLIDGILQSPQVAHEQKAQLQKMIATKGELSFYDVFTLTRVAA